MEELLQPLWRRQQGTKDVVSFRQAKGGAQQADSHPEQLERGDSTIGSARRKLQQV